MANIRIATVKATGKKYIVSFVDFRANKVTCWGELASRTGLSTKHNGTKSFMLEYVDLAEVPKTDALLQALTQQMLDGLSEEGKLESVNVSRRGNVTYRVKR